MYNIGPQRMKVYDQAQLQTAGKIWKPCIWWADTERMANTLISLRDCNKVFYAVRLIKRLLNPIGRYANREGLVEPAQIFNLFRAFAL